MKIKNAYIDCPECEGRGLEECGELEAENLFICLNCDGIGKVYKSNNDKAGF